MALSVAKNTTWMTIASIGQKVVSFLYFTLVANAIGVEDTGKYFLALSFTTVFSIFVDVGMSSVLTREVAKQKNKAKAYLQEVLTTKIITGFLAYGGILIAMWLLGYGLELRQLIMVAGVVMILDSIHLTYYGVFRALQDVRWESLGMLGSQILTMVLGLYAIHFGLPLVYLIWAFVVASALNVLYAAIRLKQLHKITYRPKLSRKVIAPIIKMALPFALAGIFARIYSSLDTVLLERMVGEYEVGLYSIPFKITFAFLFIPASLIAAVYPKMSEYYAHNKAKLDEVFFGAMRYLLIISVPIAVGLGMIAHDAVHLLYGEEFAGSVVLLQLMIISVVFSFASFPVGSVLNATDRQHVQTGLMGLAMAINAVLNIIYIPQYGAKASALIVTISYAVLFFAGMFAIRKIVSVQLVRLIWLVARILFASAIMAAVIVILEPYALPLASVIGLGALAYTVSAIGMKIATWADVKAMVNR